jgi:hypothetical protein
MQRRWRRNYQGVNANIFSSFFYRKYRFVFNLIPAFPMDVSLRALLSFKLKDI